jgi:hypothetical protein
MEYFLPSPTERNLFFLLFPYSTRLFAGLMSRLLASIMIDEAHNNSIDLSLLTMMAYTTTELPKIICLIPFD